MICQAYYMLPLQLEEEEKLQQQQMRGRSRDAEQLGSFR
jgi:hypothetical protein